MSRVEATLHVGDSPLQKVIHKTNLCHATIQHTSQQVNRWIFLRVVLIGQFCLVRGNRSVAGCCVQKTPSCHVCETSVMYSAEMVLTPKESTCRVNGGLEGGGQHWVMGVSLPLPSYSVGRLIRDRPVRHRRQQAKTLLQF